MSIRIIKLVINNLILVVLPCFFIYILKNSILVSANFYIPETDSNIVQAVKYSKGLEVFAWIELHRAANNPYCIVDDEDLFFTSQAAHFVKTDSREGLTSEVADRIIQILEAEVG